MLIVIIIALASICAIVADLNDGITMSIAVITFIILLMEEYKIWMSERIQYFRQCFADLNDDRSRFSEWMLKHYWKSESNKYQKGGYEGYLIEKIGAEEAGIEVPILISGELPEGEERKIRYEPVEQPSKSKEKFIPEHSVMPNADRTYSYNVVRHCGLTISSWGVMALSGASVLEGVISVKIYPSDYAHYFDTCQYHAFEVARVISTEDPASVETLEDFRKNMGSESGKDKDEGEEKEKSIIASVNKKIDEISYNPSDYEARVAAIGVCALTVFYNVSSGEDGGDLSAFMCIHHRGSSVAEAKNVVSLVPAGGLQLTAGIEDVDIFANNTVREFEEEIMGRTEMVEPSGYNYLVDSPLCKDFMRVYFCTMGLDPLTLKSEVITMILIDCMDPSFKRYVREMKSSIRTNTDEKIGFDERKPVTEGDLMKLVSEDVSDEGGVTLEHFTQVNVRRFKNDKRAMPVFRECMRFMDLHQVAVSELVDGQFEKAPDTGSPVTAPSDKAGSEASA